MSLETACHTPSDPAVARSEARLAARHHGLHLVPAAEQQRRALHRAAHQREALAETRHQGAIERTYVAIALSTVVFLLLSSL